MVTPGGLVGSSEGAYGRVPRGGGGVQVQGVFLRKAGFSVSVHYHLQQSKTRTKDIKHKKTPFDTCNRNVLHKGT